MLLDKVPRMGRWSIQHRSNHRRHRTLRLSPQILQMENHRQLPHRNRSSFIDILIHLWRRRLNHKTTLRTYSWVAQYSWRSSWQLIPATTPYSGVGQIIFGVGLAVLTILIQTYMNFFGGSLLALLIMNLTVPLIDRVRIRKPFGR